MWGLLKDLHSLFSGPTTCDFSWYYPKDRDFTVSDMNISVIVQWSSGCCIDISAVQRFLLILTRKEFCTDLTPREFIYLQKKTNTLVMIRISDFEFHPAKIEKVHQPFGALLSTIIEYRNWGPRYGPRPRELSNWGTFELRVLTPYLINGYLTISSPRTILTDWHISNNCMLCF